MCHCHNLSDSVLTIWIVLQKKRKRRCKERSVIHMCCLYVFISRTQCTDMMNIPWLRLRCQHRLLSGSGRYPCRWPRGFGLRWRAARLQTPDASGVYSDGTERGGREREHSVRTSCSMAYMSHHNPSSIQRCQLRLQSLAKLSYLHSVQKLKWRLSFFSTTF